MHNFVWALTPLDLLVISASILLVIAGLLLLFFLRSSKPFYFVIASAVLPLLGGLLSTFMKYQYADRALENLGAVAAEAVNHARAEAWIITYLAAIGALIIALIGLLGVVLKRRSPAKA
jgi:drug/metabolite transporter superfamily protein YnfA